jgi:hypothetical protein
MPKAAVHSIPASPSLLHNLSAADLIDELGGLKAQLADLKAREDELKSETLRVSARKGLAKAA